jgi:hypothetical protein
MAEKGHNRPCFMGLGSEKTCFGCGKRVHPILGTLPVKQDFDFENDEVGVLIERHFCHRAPECIEATKQKMIEIERRNPLIEDSKHTYMGYAPGEKPRWQR